MPPPATNFETLQDILLKRRGLKLDVSTSGALAASLDLCVVSGKESPLYALCGARRLISSYLTGCKRAFV